ncbi:MAG: T9SS type A sorting domain-containing protein [Bacteroidia bacterium]
MIKKLLFPSMIFVSAALSAQITVTSSDMPNAGDSIFISVTNSVGTIDPTLTGASYSWDYSTLTPNLQRFEKFDSPLTFPTPFNLIFNIFNTSYGRVNNTITSIPIPGVTLNAAYDFLKESSSKLKQIGAGYTINGTPLPFLYSSDDVIYTFPMNYLNTDSADYQYGLPIPTVGYYGQKGHRVNVVDGWGNVTTPFGTFNALRVKSTVAAIDTVYISTFGFGTNITQPLRYEYKWLATAQQIPVLEIDAADVLGTPTVNNVQYIDSSRAGVPHLGIAENSANNFNSSVYPNPFVDNMLVQYTLNERTHLMMSITDIFGKTIATVLDENQTAGAHQQAVNVADLGLSAGVYFFVIQTD